MKIVAHDISHRFSNIIHGLTKDEEPVTESKPRAPTHDFIGLSYLSGVASNTIDLIGEPAVQSFFQTRRQDEVAKQASPRVVSTGVDFHKTLAAQPRTTVVH